MSITTMTFAARDFSARRGASDEHTLQRSVRSEQRSLVEKELPPGGLRRIWPVAALLVGHRSTSGYAPSSRLATGQIRCNERHRSYVHDHLGTRFRLELTERPIHERPQRNKSCAEQRHSQRPTGRFGARGEKADEHGLSDFGLKDLREGMTQAARWQVHAQRTNHGRRDFLRLLK